LRLTAIYSLFDKRGSIYSSRPDDYVGNQLLCPNEVHILLVPYGDAWRKLRKAVQSVLNLTAIDKFLPIQNAEAAQTLYQLLKDPGNCWKHLRRYSTAVILASVFGQRGESYESEKVQALYHAQEQFTALLAPGAHPPVDAFPFLRYIPSFLAPWKIKASLIRQEQRSLYFKLMNETQARIASGGATGCFMEKLISEQEKSALTEEQVAYTGGGFVSRKVLSLKAELTDFKDGGGLRHHFINAADVCPSHDRVSWCAKEGSEGVGRCLWDESVPII
jgi:cytochrome P450